MKKTRFFYIDFQYYLKKGVPGVLGVPGVANHFSLETYWEHLKAKSLLKRCSWRKIKKFLNQFVLCARERCFSTTLVVVQLSPRAFLTILNILNKQTKEFVMNQEEALKYEDHFPKTVGLSGKEYFIDFSPAKMAGLAYFDNYGGCCGSRIDFSKYSGLCLKVSANDLDYYAFETTCKNFGLKKDFLNQAFFDSVFSVWDEKPKIETIDSKYFASEKGGKEIGETFNINCIISPIAPMDRSLIYKVEVYVETLVQKLPVSYRDEDSDFIIANLIQKYFIVDKEGLFFEEQVKKALEICFMEIKEAFLETQKKRIYVINQDKKAADYEPSASKQ